MASLPTVKGVIGAGLPSTRKLQYAAFAIAIFLAATLAWLDQHATIERPIQNIRDAINSKPASGQIHLVEVDAKSLQALENWPWPRRLHAKLLDQLDAAGVDQIMFDIDFSSRSSLQDDSAFAAAIDRAGGKVVLPTFRQPASSGETLAEIENLPIPMLRKNAFLGSVNVRPAANGQVNEYPFGTITDGTPRPSLAALLSETSGPLGSQFSIDHSIDIDTLPRHSFVDIIEGRFDKNALRGKKILIGATAIEIGDRYATGRFGVIPGVVIQAIAAETLIAGTNLPRLGPWPLLLLTAIAIALWPRRFTRKIGSLAVCATALAITVLGIALLAERFKLAHLSVTPALVMVLLSVVAQRFAALSMKMIRERGVDQLSRLPNMVAWQAHNKSAERATIIVATIVNFDEISSTLEHDDPAKYIASVAERLGFSVGAETLYRIAPEQFCWSSKSMANAEIEAVLDATGHMFNAPIQIGGRPLRTTICFGIVHGVMDNPAAMANKASLAAKRAAEIGLRYLWHDESLAHDVDQSIFIVSEFEDALATGRITVAYQPKFSIADGRVTGAEALIRWDHAQRGAISPAIFVPVLERENLMEALTLFVLRQVVGDVARWNSTGDGMQCAVNVSASLLMNAQFVDHAIAVITRSGIDPKLLTFELTETAVLSSLETASATLMRFKQLGAKISIDDYGTGQSTLSYLKNFPADEIKIDQSFVRLIATDNANRIMVRSTIEMAKALDISVVAEGVEDAATMNVLKDLGCDNIQGWYIGKPLRPEQFAEQWCRKPAPQSAALPRKVAAARSF
jgi:diguanylate cyclase